MSEEEWRDVVGWEGLYQVSSLGRVRSLDRTICAAGRSAYVQSGRVLKPSLVCGYEVVSLRAQDRPHKTGKPHRLACIAFHGPPPDERSHAEHLDGNRRNNRVGNLRWATPTENIRRKNDHGTMTRGEAVGLAKLTEEQVLAIRAAADAGETNVAIAARFGIGRSNVQNIRDGATWTHILRRVDRPKYEAAGAGHHNASLTLEDVQKIRALHAAGTRGSVIALEMGLSRQTVSLIVRRKTWKHVP